MATELATAYVALVPSMKGFARQLESQMGGIDTSRAASKVGGGLASGIISKVRGAATAAVGMIGSIGGAIGSMAASGGISRALNIEKAQTMFKGLKLDWKDFEGTIMGAVDGTAFTMDAAALAAANLAASGVGAGKDMEEALRGAVGVSATFGAELGDIGGIYSKVAAQGKITGETIQQFADRGINVTSVLSKALGKSGEEIRQMVTDGKIDFATFSAAMEKSFGDGASSANETFTGSLANMKAALSKIGAKFATPLTKLAVPVFNAVRLALNAISASLDPLVEKVSVFGDMVSSAATGKLGAFTSALEKGGSIADGLRAALGDVGGTVATVAAAVGGLGAVFGALSTVFAVIPGIGGLLGTLSGGAGAVAAFKALIVPLGTAIGALGGPVAVAVAAVGALAAAFGYVMASDEGFRSGVTGTGGCVGPSLMPAVASLVATVRDAAQTVIPAVVSAMQQLAPPIAGLVQAVLQVAAALAPVVAQLVATLMPVVTQIVQTVAGVATRLSSVLVPVVTGITNLIVQNIPFIQQVFAQVCAAVQTIVQTVWPAVQRIIEQSCSMIFGFVETTWPLIEELIGAVMAAVQGFMDDHWPAIQAAVQGACDAILAVIDAVWPYIQTVVDTVMTAIQNVISVATAIIEGDWDAAWGAIGKLFSDAWEGIQAGAEAGLEMLATFMSTVPGKILDVLGNLGGLLWDAGMTIIGGLINGLKAGVGKMIDYVKGIAGDIAANKGPKSYDMKLLVPNGKWIMSSLVRGLSAGEAGLMGKLGDITEEITRAVSPDIDVKYRGAGDIGGAGRAGASGKSQTTIYNINGINVDGESAAARAIDRLAVTTRIRRRA